MDQSTARAAELIPLTPVPDIIPYQDALQITGGVSKPSKMPGVAWGIDARHCHTGGRLRKLKGTACSLCYAHKGNYCRTNVRAAMERRLKGSEHPLWAKAMVTMIAHHTPWDTPYFRWFDSGDLQSFEQLIQIIWIANRLPGIQFWLPTSERRYLKRLMRENVSIPANLLIRYSSPLIDSISGFWPWSSSVVTDDSWTCTAPTTDNQCGDCRKCWDPAVKTVSYKRH